MAGSGLKGGIAYGATDEIGFHALEDLYHVTNSHATVCIHWDSTHFRRKSLVVNDSIALLEHLDRAFRAPIQQVNAKPLPILKGNARRVVALCSIGPTNELESM
jgi:Protein of unknown function (DUF1501)